MLLAFISDIHGNLEALKRILWKIRSLPVDRIICLGDLVGYNADPNGCIEEVFSATDRIIRGNHDKATAGFMSLSWFNPAARDAVLWTRRTLMEENLRRIKALREGPVLVEGPALICHGAPMDEDRYIFDRAAVEESFSFMRENYPGVRVCFFGHTHTPAVIDSDVNLLGCRSTVLLEEGKSYLINPGSVGQPRDGVPLASFGIFDTVKFSYTNERISYNIEETQRKILEARLPSCLAFRLARGN